MSVETYLEYLCKDFYFIANKERESYILHEKDSNKEVVEIMTTYPECLIMNKAARKELPYDKDTLIRGLYSNFDRADLVKQLVKLN